MDADPKSPLQDGRSSAFHAASCYASSCGRVTLYLGDCLELRYVFPPGCAIITDPPYGMDWNPETTRFSGGNNPSQRSAGRNDRRKVMHDDEPFDPSPWLVYEKCVMWGMHHFAARLPVGTVLTWIKRNDDAFGSFLSDAELAWMKGGHGVYCKRDLSMNGETATLNGFCNGSASTMTVEATRMVNVDFDDPAPPGFEKFVEFTATAVIDDVASAFDETTTPGEGDPVMLLRTPALNVRRGSTR